jgi:prevent-host-death family protein
MRKIEVEKAQAKLSALMKEALAGRPTIITKDNEKLVIVLSYDDYKNLSRRSASCWRTRKARVAIRATEAPKSFDFSADDCPCIGIP